MQERPDKQALLTSIARFLIEDVRPKLTGDARLSFRALIAANLANIVAQELATDGAQTEAELGRLREIFPDAAVEPMPGAIEERRVAIAALNARLARTLRTEEVGRIAMTRVAVHLRATLREKLAVDNPRFDLANEIE